MINKVDIKLKTTNEIIKNQDYLFDLAKGGYNNEIKLATLNRLTNEDYIYEIATGNLSDLVLPARRRLEAIGSKKISSIFIL